MSIDVEKVDALRRAFEVAVTKPETLNVGDIVVISPDYPGGFTFPSEEEPGLLMEWLARPFYGFDVEGGGLREIAGTPQGAYRYDCIVIVRGEDGDIRPFLIDSRKLKKVG